MTTAASSTACTAPSVACWLGVVTSSARKAEAVSRPPRDDAVTCRAADRTCPDSSRRTRRCCRRMDVAVPRKGVKKIKK